jgi:hypothetical protein
MAFYERNYVYEQRWINLPKIINFAERAISKLKPLSYDIPRSFKKKCKLNLEQPIQYYLVFEDSFTIRQLLDKKYILKCWVTNV